MPFIAIINFRGSAGGATDGAGQSYCLDSDIYSGSAVRGGPAFGWVSGHSSVGGADRSATGPDVPEFAGIHYMAARPSPPGHDFRLDLPAAGTYSVRIALGDAASGQGGLICHILDGPGGAALATVAAGLDVGADHFLDATGVERTGPDNWRTANAAATVTATGASLVVRMGDSTAFPAHTGDTSVIAHLEVADAGGGGDTTPPTLSGATVPTGGTTLTATLSESGCGPASGSGGFTLAGTNATVTSWAVSGTTLTLTLARKVYVGQAVTLNYSRAATTNDIADAAGNFLADFAGAAVANGSTQRKPLLLIGVG